MMTSSQHAYEVRPRKDHRGIDLISDALPFGRLWYDGPNAASNVVNYEIHYSCSHDAVIRVYDATGNVIETHEHRGRLARCDGMERHILQAVGNITGQGSAPGQSCSIDY